MMSNKDMSRLLVAVFHHPVLEPDSESGLDHLVALIEDTTKEDMRTAVANAVAAGYIHDPVRLPAGALQCHWHLELTPRGVDAARRSTLLTRLTGTKEHTMRTFSLVGECREKSELVRRLVVELTGRGLRVSTIKRVSDTVDLERAGSGTWKHRTAGAEEVMIASASRFALLREMPKDTQEPDVSLLLARMAPVDIVLLDGFRRSGYPKMEVVPSGQGQAVLAQSDKMVLAVTSQEPVTAPVPWMPLSDVKALCDLVMSHAVTGGVPSG